MGIEPRTSRFGVRRSTTTLPRSQTWFVRDLVNKQIIHILRFFFFFCCCCFLHVNNPLGRTGGYVAGKETVIILFISNWSCLWCRVVFFLSFPPDAFWLGLYTQLSRDVRKPVFGVSDQVRHKSVCVATENGKKLERPPEISDLGRRRVVLSV